MTLDGAEPAVEMDEGDALEARVDGGNPSLRQLVGRQYTVPLEVLFRAAGRRHQILLVHLARGWPDRRRSPRPVE